MNTTNSEADRKLKEAEFHDRRERLRQAGTPEYEAMTKNLRFYSVNRASKTFMDGWLRSHCGPGTRVLDYCCGTGLNSEFVAECGADVTGIDISAASVEKARARLTERGLEGRATFLVADAENTGLPDGHFDVILCNGILHHLDVTKAFPELARILKPGGSVFCVEAMAHNPVFQLYRKLTPHMRTEWEAEHILGKDQIKLASKYFADVNLNFFHLADLLAVPLRRVPPVFEAALPLLNSVDRVILSVPGLRWWAWQCLFILSKPRQVTP
jgi:ubiquinone/menaquinone biosynthesis C-methylase UbiE